MAKVLIIKWSYLFLVNNVIMMIENILKWGVGHPTVSWTYWTRARSGHCKSVRPQVHMKCSIWDRAFA